MNFRTLSSGSSQFVLRHRTAAESSAQGGEPAAGKRRLPKRLNKRPIFVVSFAYGGSNILLNLLRSHPDVCSPRGELNEVFKGKPTERRATRTAKFMRYLPCILIERADIFRVQSWAEPRPFTPLTQHLIDRIFYGEKFRARHVSQNLYKTEHVLRTDAEIASSRLMCKNLDGLIFVSRELARMYPDATFLGLIRNGLAVCEGHVRRGYVLEEIARSYELGCQRMIEDSTTIPNFHLIRYEDMIARPREMLETIYGLADLPIDKVEKVRLQTKRIIQPDGSHAIVHNTEWKQVLWYPLDEFHKHFVRDANENQIKRLTPAQRDAVIAHCERSLRHFGYLDSLA